MFLTNSSSCQKFIAVTSGVVHFHFHFLSARLVDDSELIEQSVVWTNSLPTIDVFMHGLRRARLNKNRMRGVDEVDRLKLCKTARDDNVHVAVFGRSGMGSRPPNASLCSSVTKSVIVIVAVVSRMLLLPLQHCSSCCCSSKITTINGRR